MTKKIVTFTLILAIIIGVFSISYYIAIDKYRAKKILTNKDNHTAIEKQIDNLGQSSTAVSSDVISPAAKVKFVTKENGEEKTLATIEIRKINVSTKNQLEQLYSKGSYKIDKCSEDEIVLLKQEVSYLKNKYYIGIDDGDIAIFKTDDLGRRTKEEFDETKSIQSLVNKSGEISFVNDILNDNAFYDSRDKVEERLEDYN